MKHYSSKIKGAKEGDRPKFIVKDPTTGLNVYDLHPARPVTQATEYAICDGGYRNPVAFTDMNKDRGRLWAEIVTIFQTAWEVAFPSSPYAFASNRAVYGS